MAGRKQPRTFLRGKVGMHQGNELAVGEQGRGGRRDGKAGSRHHLETTLQGVASPRLRRLEETLQGTASSHRSDSAPGSG